VLARKLRDLTQKLVDTVLGGTGSWLWYILAWINARLAANARSRFANFCSPNFVYASFSHRSSARSTPTAISAHLSFSLSACAPAKKRW
jgi:hypothetical protein